jgi:hypothetical protein
MKCRLCPTLDAAFTPAALAEHMRERHNLNVDPAKLSQKPAPVAIQRLMDEVRNGQVTEPHAFNRVHNRHNRS